MGKKKKAKKIKRGSFRRVWSGTVATSKGGLTKDKLTRTRRGGRLQEGPCAGPEGLQADFRMDQRVHEGPEAAQAQGLPRHQEGHRVLQVGASALREVSRQSFPRIDRCTTTWHV